MTREEMLAIAKPILFNTEMVRAIRDNRKTATRRVVKPQHLRVLDIPYHKEYPETPDKVLLERLCNPPYQPGDILYVPEAWKCSKPPDPSTLCYEVVFRDGTITKFQFTDKKRFDKWEKYWDKPDTQWQSPYFMPKEAARLFLQVTAVRVERLQDITEEQARKEGIDFAKPLFCANKDCDLCNKNKSCQAYVHEFKTLWNSTIPKHPNKFKRFLYYWEDNPWVWVIEFERVEAEK